MSPRNLAFALVACVLLASSGAEADTPIVYDRDTGPTGPKTFATDQTTLDLQIDLGLDVSAGTPCEDGTGDELCGADILVEVIGPAMITSFTPIGDIVFDPDPLLPTAKLRLNLLQSINPPAPGAQDLGGVTITRTGASASSPLTVEVGGQAVDARGALVTIPTRTVAVPEPKGGVLLVSGVLFLIFLYRLRTRSETRTVGFRREAAAELATPAS
jgi:hypothetical protein